MPSANERHQLGLKTRSTPKQSGAVSRHQSGVPTRQPLSTPITTTKMESQHHSGSRRPSSENRCETSNTPVTKLNENDCGSQQQSEEGIQVAIRMRPLNSKEANESSSARVWKVLKKHNSVTQTTSEGKPLPDRTLGRTFFYYDKVFGEDASTNQIYDKIAKNIVSSVTSGLNGTIFAYGQTSSGKTFTMQGTGGYGGMNTAAINNNKEVPGIVHMAAADIFQHIENETSRAFLLRVSFIEIYNEEVRDLLVSGAREPNVLHVREDPNRGVFVNSNEIIVSTFTSLLDTLFAGVKNRAVASTQMNEQSSRSHTIFRITVESRKKSGVKKNNTSSDTESDDDDVTTDSRKENDEPALVSTLNLVDLAGSESVRHTGATGDRMKEGAKINQSLLTLSRVMVALGQPNNTHINFRDSKLTRILQPSLSGNARMAVICCATPSALYLEETRSTLQFASRAKLVKTNAKINEVLDQRSLIKKLQRELSEAKRAVAALNNGKPYDNGAANMEEMKALKEEKCNLEAQVKKLKAFILNGGMLTDTAALSSQDRSDPNDTVRPTKIDSIVSTPCSPVSSPVASSPFKNKLSADSRRAKECSLLVNELPSDECNILLEASDIKLNVPTILLEENHHVNEPHQRLKIKIKGLIKDYDASKTLSESLEKGKNAISDQNKVTIADREAKMVTFEKDIKNLKSTIQMLNEKVKTLEEINAKMTSQMETVCEKNRSLQDELTINFSEKEPSLVETKNLKDIVKNLLLKMAELSEEKHCTVRLVENMAAEVKESKSLEKESSLDEIRELKDKINVLSLKIADLSKEKKRYVRLVDNFRISDINLKRRLRLVQEEREKLQVSVERLETNDAERKKIVDELNKSLDAQIEKPEENFLCMITCGLVGLLQMCLSFSFSTPRLQLASTTETSPMVDSIDRNGCLGESLLENGYYVDGAPF